MSNPPQARALLLAVLLGACPAALGAQGPLQHWKSATALPVAQAFAASVGFQGKLWVIGGESQAAAQTSVQVLDPASNLWASGPSLPTARTRARTGAIGSRLWVVGGRIAGSPTRSTLELVQGKWKNSTNLNTARDSHALVADATGLYALGGRTGRTLTAVKSCERFDSVLGTWSSLVDMPGPRFGHSAHLAGGKLYVFGGFATTESQPLRSTWVYDLATKAWSVGSALSEQIRFHGYGTSYVDAGGHRILLGGLGSASADTSGTSCERLDLASGQPRWFACTPARLPILAAAASTVAGRTFVAGGAHDTPGGLVASTRVQELSKITLTRTTVAVGPGFPWPVEVVHPPLVTGKRMPVLIFEPGLSEKPSYYSQLRDQLAALGFFVMSHDTSLFLDPSTFSKVQVAAAQEIAKSPTYGPFLEDRHVFGGFSAGGGGSLISASAWGKTAAVFALAPWAGCAPSTIRCGAKSPVIAKAGGVRAPTFLMANQGDALGTPSNTDWILENLGNAERFRVSYVLVDKDHGGKDTGQGFADTHVKTLPAGRALQERVYRYVFSFLDATVLDSPSDPGPQVLARSGEAHAQWVGDGPRQDPAILRTKRFVRRPELYLRLPGGTHAGAQLQLGVLGPPSTPALVLLSGGTAGKIAIGSLGNFLLDLNTLVVVPVQLPTSGLLDLALTIPPGLAGVLHFQSLGFDDAPLPSLHLSGWRRSMQF